MIAVTIVNNVVEHKKADARFSRMLKGFSVPWQSNAGPSRDGIQCFIRECQAFS